MYRNSILVVVNLAKPIQFKKSFNHHDRTIDHKVEGSKTDQTEPNFIAHNGIINKVCKTEHVVTAHQYRRFIKKFKIAVL
jgi:hypothetical protein